MSSEECPFCGKTYKRLKSHLPHCKAAATTQVKSKQTSLAHLVSSISDARPKAKKSPQKLSVEANPQSKKSKKVSTVSPQSSSPAVTAKNVNTSSPSLSSSLSIKPSTKKKKPKLSEQIKTDRTPSSNITAPSPSISKKKSLPAVIEPVKHDQVTKQSQERTRSASEDLHSGSKSRSTAQTRAYVVADNTSLSTDTKPKDTFQKKMSKKAAVQSLPTFSDSMDLSMDSGFNKSIAKHCVKDLWVENMAETEDSSVKKSNSDHQARITIQHVKTWLNRAKATTQSSEASFLTQTDINNNLKTSFHPGLSPVTAPVKNHRDEVATRNLSKQLSCTCLQQTELQQVKKSSKSLISLQRDGSPHPKQPVTVALLSSGHPSSQVSQATGACTSSMTEALKVGHHMTDFLSLSTSPLHFSSPYCFPTASHNILPQVETQKDEDVAILDRKPKAAHNPTNEAVTQRSLGQVRLRELPEWLACRTPRHPRGVVDMVHRGWQWYYRKYIDVKKGGVGGLAMLLAGYCVLSYIWSYPHIKNDRWRKYH